MYSILEVSIPIKVIHLQAIVSDGHPMTSSLTKWLTGASYVQKILKAIFC